MHNILFLFVHASVFKSNFLRKPWFKEIYQHGEFVDKNCVSLVLGENIQHILTVFSLFCQSIIFRSLSLLYIYIFNSQLVTNMRRHYNIVKLKNKIKKEY